MNREDKKAILYYYVIPAVMFLSPWLGSFGFVLMGLMCLHIFFDLSFQGFTRQSRFALSRYHPVVNRILNILILLLPFTVFLFGRGAFIFIPFLLAIHIFSEIRSPDVSVVEKSRFASPLWRYLAWMILYFAGLAAILNY